jgi:SAM-dependent methyltransferase
MAETFASGTKIPENYDRYLAPLYFNHYADDLVARLPVHDGMRILEVACGTGIVTRRLVERLAGRGSIIATDLDESMFAQARKRLPGPGDPKYRHANGISLPFESQWFDAVVCQFGLMFVDDKAAGAREAFRVLKPGGAYLLNVWDSLVSNPVARITCETVTAFFPDDPPACFTVPWAYHDRGVLEALLRDAGFADVRVTYVDKEGTCPTAAEAAIGSIDGGPALGEIMKRRPEAVGAIKAAIAENLARELGDHPLRAPLRAVVVTARRPGG